MSHLGLSCLSRLCAAMTLAVVPGALAQGSHAAELDRLLASPGFRGAAAHIDGEHGRIVDEAIRLTEIPAPPYQEEARARQFRRMLQESGLPGAQIDREGNVIALRKGTRPNGKVVVVSAHIDTVFPAGTDVTVRRLGTKLVAPGVGDDSMSLSVLLALARAMNAAGIRTRDDLLFVGTVGAEGTGDLRGVRYLFTGGGYKDRIKSFVSIESGSVASVTNGGVGTKRYRVTFRGPGGHSFDAFGLVNPIYALSQAASEFSRTQVAASPKTSYSVGVIGGGTSVNSIPRSGWMEVDMRSESVPELRRVEERLLRIVREAADRENGARSTREGRITVKVQVIGDRPAGTTDPKADLVQFARCAIEAAGYKVSYQWSSTDANLPMSLGIPAITIGRLAPDHGGRSHSLDEWIDVDKAPMVKAITTSLSIVLAAAGIE